MKEPIVVAPLELTERQGMRIAAALAVHKAKCAALDEGLSLDEVEALTWTVTLNGKEWKDDHG